MECAARTALRRSYCLIGSRTVRSIWLPRRWTLIHRQSLSLLRTGRTLSKLDNVLLGGLLDSLTLDRWVSSQLLWPLPEDSDGTSTDAAPLPARTLYALVGFLAVPRRHSAVGRMATKVANSETTPNVNDFTYAGRLHDHHSVLEDSIVDQARGGQGNNVDRAGCVPGGMP
jgi:hypothetical protein